jgi:Flp pilus assembly protein TadG
VRIEHRDRGAAALEFALILPILLIFVAGMVDMGQALNAQIIMDDSARETVRTLTLTGDTTNATNMANSSAQPYSIDWGSSSLSGCAGGSTAQADLQAKVDFWIPNLIPGLPSSIQIAGKASMQCMQ